MSRPAFAVVALLLASGVAAHTTQDVRSPQAGASGIPQVVSSVVPVYPPIARSARVSGDVVLAITVGAEGQPTDVRVTQSIPLLDVAAVQATRQWRFQFPPPGTTPVVSVRLRFLLRTFAPPAAVARGPGLPQDFAVQYSYSCAAGLVEVDTSRATISELDRGAQPATRPLTIAAAEETRLYTALSAGGFFDVAPPLPLPVPSAAVTVSDRGLEMAVDGGPVQLINVTSAPNSARYPHQISVRRNGSVHILTWDEPVAADAAARQYSSIGAAVRDVVTRANGGATPEPGRNVCP